jgi:hypothetical protein
MSNELTSSFGSLDVRPLDSVGLDGVPVDCALIMRNYSPSARFFAIVFSLPTINARDSR